MMKGEIKEFHLIYLIRLEELVKEFQMARTIRALTAHPLSIFCPDSRPLLKTERDLDTAIPWLISVTSRHSRSEKVSRASAAQDLLTSVGIVCLVRRRQTPDSFRPLERQKKSRKQAVRLALAMGEVVQRVGTAFFSAPRFYFGLPRVRVMVPFSVKEVPFPCLICDDILSPD